LKVIILAGGFGTRLSEYTESIPKPLVKIGNKPIIVHIMEIFDEYGFNDFIIATGYKSELIKEYFLNINYLYDDFEIDLKNNNINFLSENNKKNWKIKIVDTGLSTMTGGRLLRLKDFINEPFLLTYGDGLSNVNIIELIKFHESQNKIATVTAVHPIARFGEITILNNQVTNFIEKPQMNNGWINGGFFVFNPKIFEYLSNDNSILEKDALELLSSQSQLSAFKHEGFWQCMDTKRDKDYLESFIMKDIKLPWLKND